MGFFSAGQTTTTSKNGIPEWMNQAGQYNYGLAMSLAGRPYTPYSGQRIAGFNDDQNFVENFLKNWKPSTMSGNGSITRLIDNIPGTGRGGGTINDYMNPFISNVLDRTQNNIRRSTDMAKVAQSGVSAHGAGAFGDSRHGIADAEIERAGIDRMGDAAAQGYENAYNNAMQLRQSDLSRLDTKQRQKISDTWDYLRARGGIGDQRQQQSQKNLDMNYADFLRQLNYPQEQLNMLISTLNGTPHETTQTNTSPSASGFSKLLSTILGIGSLF